jgi:glycosyltransferase involved in cell wall biosynthesis
MLSLHVDTETAWRGGPNQVLYTVTGLRAAGHRAVLVADPAGELFRRMREGVDLVPLPSRADIDMSAAWDLSRVLKQFRPDLVHAHEPRAVALLTLALSIAAPRPRPPFVASHRTETRLPHTSFGRWTISEVDCFIANSRSVADRLRSDGVVPARTAVVHEGVDVERIARVQPANLHADFFLPTHAPIVGTVAPLVPHKGLHHLIAAAALAVREVPDARFVIVGEGPLRASLEKQIHELHLERHIFLAGFRVDVIEATRAFDVFAMSSVSEGMCTALVDAMAAARPAVVTDVGGIPEVAVDGKTAFMVAAKDEEAMARQIVHLLKDDQLRQDMGAAAQKRAGDLFRVDRMVDETVAVYEQLLNSTARPVRSADLTLGVDSRRPG